MSALTAAALAGFIEDAGADQWGVAVCPPEPWPFAPALPLAVSLGIRLEPDIIADVEHGPTPAYYAEYGRVNVALLDLTHRVAGFLREHGAAAEPVQPTGSPAPGEIDWTDARVFAHKTAATQAGLGWIGKTAIFVSPRLGPWVRLATVFTDAPLAAGDPVTEGRCRGCRRCVDACPAGAGRDVTWRAGMPRDALLDVAACERQNASNVDTVGDICGVCLAVCPFGRRLLRG
jgi:epoxyqueuosine reductase QueG